MVIQLDRQLESVIANRMRSGRYASPADIVAAGLEALDREDLEGQQDYETLKAKVQVGIDEADRGECKPLDMNQLMRDARTAHEAKMHSK